MLSLPFFFVLAVLALLFKTFSSLLEKRRYASEAAARGCAGLPELPRKGLLGLGRLSEVSKANSEGRLPQWFMKKFDEVGEDCNTFVAGALDYKLILTRDPMNARAMFSTNSDDFEISPHRKDIWSPLLGNGIFTAQGEAWKHSRKLLRPQVSFFWMTLYPDDIIYLFLQNQFSRDQISDLELEEQHIQSLLSLPALKPGKNGWTSNLDLAPLFLNFTLDVATEFLYGRSVNSQSVEKMNNEAVNEDGGLDSGFSYHLDAGKSWLYTKGLYGQWNRLIHSPQLTRHCKEVHRFVDQLVMERLNRPSSLKLPGDSQRFFLLDELAKTTQNPLELRNETLQLLNAGRDTTGALLGWIFYTLARSPRVFEKLRKSIISTFGSDRTGHIDFQILKQCQYLNHCIQEVLRVSSVVPVNERVCIRDTVLPTGGGANKDQPVFLKKGQRVLIANHAMQHRADLWGPDVDEFNPERWEAHRAGFEFLPFGAGPRKCIGRK
jgi:cytochrome P450